MDSPLITRLKAAHAVVLGKTNMHELAAGTTTVSPWGVHVLNPYNNTRHSGGNIYYLQPQPASVHACMQAACTSMHAYGSTGASRGVQTARERAQRKEQVQFSYEVQLREG